MVALTRSLLNLSTPCSDELADAVMTAMRGQGVVAQSVEQLAVLLMLGVKLASLPVALPRTI